MFLEVCSLSTLIKITSQLIPLPSGSRLCMGARSMHGWGLPDLSREARLPPPGCPDQDSNAVLPSFSCSVSHLPLHQPPPLGLRGPERLLLNHTNTPGFLAPGGEEFNPGPETRLDCSELLCNKVLLKYKGDRESF